MTKDFTEELINQIEDKDGYREGVVVKLYSEDMSDITEIDIHTRKFHRIWMTDEYLILNRKELKQMKEKWNNI